MYLLHAPIEKFGKIPPNTPIISDEVKFTNNIAFTNKYYWRKVHCMNKCIDITPKSLKSLNEKREYNFVVFIVKGGIGDCLWMMPIIKEFKARHQKCYITVIIEPKHKAIWTGCQFINEVMVDTFWNAASVIRKAENVYEFMGVATIFKNLMKYDPIEATFKEMNWKLPKEKSKLRPDICVMVDDGKKAEKYLEERGIKVNEKKLVTIGIDASTHNRHYPIDYVREVTEALLVKDINVVWLGKSEEFRKSLIVKKFNKIGFLNAVAETSLREATAIIGLSNLHINPNSGLLVISTALNIPTIGLFGAFHPKIRTKFYERYKSLYVPQKCSPCNEHWTECRHGHPAPCMKNITPRLVYDSALEMLEKYPRSLMEKMPIE